MAKKLSVRFVRPLGPYVKGHVMEVGPDQLARLRDHVEVLTAPTTRAEPSVDDSPLVAELHETIDVLRHQLAESDRKVETLQARVVELEDLVAAYTVAKPEPPATPAPEPVAEPIAEEPEPEVSEPVEQPAPEPVVEEPAPEPAETPAPEPAAPEPTVAEAAWTRHPVASLNIPSSLKSLLIKGGMKTAGEVAEGLVDGRVLAIDGIGETKTEQLREHLAALAAAS